MKPWEIVKKYGAYDSYMTDGFICAVFPYLPEEISEGNISLYARGQDYHIWVKEILNKAVVTPKQKPLPSSISITIPVVR